LQPLALKNALPKFVDTNTQNVFVYAFGLALRSFSLHLMARQQKRQYNARLPGRKPDPEDLE